MTRRDRFGSTWKPSPRSTPTTSEQASRRSSSTPPDPHNCSAACQPSAWTLVLDCDAGRPGHRMCLLLTVEDATAYRETVEDSIYVAPDRSVAESAACSSTLCSPSAQVQVSARSSPSSSTPTVRLPRTASQPWLRRRRTAHRGRLQARPVAGHAVVAAESASLTRFTQLAVTSVQTGLSLRWSAVLRHSP